jgi:DNA polymerase/3'-5' exonuclease PolX
MPATSELNKQIASLFFSKANNLTAKGERYKFRAIAYVRAAQAIENLDRGLDEIYQHGWLVGLEKINGIGNRLAHEIETELKKREIIKK